MLLSQGLVFPYTRLSGRRADRLLDVCAEIILFSFPDDQGGEGGPDDRVVRRVVNFLEDASASERMMADFRRWSEEYSRPGQLAALKAAMDQKDPERSAARLMSAIRRGPEQSPPEEPLVKAQIFLMFAEMLDRQRNEVDELIWSVNQRDGVLGDLLGAEPLDEADRAARDLPPRERLHPEDTAALNLLPVRLKAWAEIFGAAAGEADGPLITDQPEAAARLDMNLARRFADRLAPLSAGMDVLKPLARLSPPRSAEEEAFLADLIDRAGQKPYTLDEIEALRAEADRPVDPDAPWTASVYMLPGDNRREALALAAGARKTDALPPVYSGPVIVVESGR
jgi:hypothetical protein